MKYKGPYVLNEQDKAIVSKQVNDIAHGIESFNQFKYGAIAELMNQKKTYTERWADRQKEIICTTGITAGICNSCSICEKCSVFGAHKEAVEEIRAGKRSKKHDPEETNRGCRTNVWISKKGVIHITQYM